MLTKIKIQCFSVRQYLCHRSTNVAATWFTVAAHVRYPCQNSANVCRHMMHCGSTCTLPVLPQYTRKLLHDVLWRLLYSTSATTVQTSAATWCTVAASVHYQCYRSTNVSCFMMYCGGSCTVPVPHQCKRLSPHDVLWRHLYTTSATAVQTSTSTWCTVAALVQNQCHNSANVCRHMMYCGGICIAAYVCNAVALVRYRYRYSTGTATVQHVAAYVCTAVEQVLYSNGHSKACYSIRL
jgi:hypothetical protein